VLSRNPYERADVERAMAANPDLTNLTPSYVRAMAYDYQTLAGYVREQQDDQLLIVIGDHQPPAAVSGEGAPWNVPIHVVTARRPILDRLTSHGFVRGLHPKTPAVAKMHALLRILLEAFGPSDS
jgi:hypothetical protein